ncbi:DUF116 domain-containing protein [Methanosalsum natronophilum]|uniref:DUF116 domain-containing protein n=1 Tax=Methanosalsum natronophilum TaxID=768733 RepID=A0A424YXB0_9EURY|nr:DUF116 domain-containing protein [Methanosalsum natronophilum]MCS3922956.1 hypothetical protein [Methanosalsum natronophilum]RQD84889.1 MAG: DUF116 domain-containing protein [Methanosalsum natronophilum]
MYSLIGLILFVIIVLSVSLSIIALFASKMSVNRHVSLASFFANILDFFYLPIKSIFDRFHDVTKLDMWMVSLKNMANFSRFKNTKNRLILAPHCMRSLNCPAHSTQFGIMCEECGRCMFDNLKKDAKKYNYKLYIVAGSSYIRHIVKKESADAALLIACYYELNKVMMSLKNKGIVTYGIPLMNDGCYATQVDYVNVKKTLQFLDE